MAFPTLAVRHRLAAATRPTPRPTLGSVTGPAADAATTRRPDPAAGGPQPHGGALPAPPAIPADRRPDPGEGWWPARPAGLVPLPLPAGVGICLVCLWSTTGGDETAAACHTRGTGHPTVSRPVDPARPGGGGR